MTRAAYSQQIQELRDDVVAMASMVDKAIARSTEALQRRDIDQARVPGSGDRPWSNASGCSPGL